MNKDPEIKSKLERIPDEDQITLTPYEADESSWLYSAEGVNIKPTKLGYDPNYLGPNSGHKKPKVEDLVIDKQDPKEIAKEINNWLDNIVGYFNK